MNEATRDNLATGESKSLVLYTDSVAINTFDQDTIIGEHYLREHHLGKLPVAVFPPHIDRRITAQRSVFTLHGSEKDGFSVLAKKYSDAQVCKIRIAPDSIDGVITELTRAGVTESTLFPDLEGLAREIKAEYGMLLKSR